MKIIRVASCWQCPYLETKHYGTVWWCASEQREIVDNTDIYTATMSWCPLEDKEAGDEKH